MEKIEKNEKSATKRVSFIKLDLLVVQTVLNKNTSGLTHRRRIIKKLFFGSSIIHTRGCLAEMAGLSPKFNQFEVLTVCESYINLIRICAFGLYCANKLLRTVFATAEVAAYHTSATIWSKTTRNQFIWSKKV